MKVDLLLSARRVLILALLPVVLAACAAPSATTDDRRSGYPVPSSVTTDDVSSRFGTSHDVGTVPHGFPTTDAEAASKASDVNVDGVAVSVDDRYVVETPLAGGAR